MRYSASTFFCTFPQREVHEASTRERVHSLYILSALKLLLLVVHNVGIIIISLLFHGDTKWRLDRNLLMVLNIYDMIRLSKQRKS